MMLFSNQNLLAEFDEQSFVQFNGLQVNAQKRGRFATSPLASSC